MPLWFWLIILGFLLVFLANMWWVGSRANSPAVARQRFDRHLALLKGAFFHAASTSGKPRGLVWTSIDWHEGMTLVREKKSRQLAALVGVTIAFEAVAGGDMEGVAAVANLRHGSAVFFYHRGRWHTTGRALFNLLPEDVPARMADQYDRV